MGIVGIIEKGNEEVKLTSETSDVHNRPPY